MTEGFGYCDGGYDRGSSTELSVRGGIRKIGNI